MRRDSSKGIYEDFLTSVERGFFNSELNKVVDRNILIIQLARWAFTMKRVVIIEVTTSLPAL